MRLRLIKFFKDALLRFPVTLLLSPFTRFFHFLFYFNKLIRWIHKHKKSMAFHDFYEPKRDYDKRYRLYEYVMSEYGLAQSKIAYLEFGVAQGASFRWWMKNTLYRESAFWGFDTFEGLPEDWADGYNKGAMAAPVPSIEDSRGKFIKGLFQDTLSNFLKENGTILTQSERRVIHMDADLYSATAFALSQLYPFLRPGDVIFFDEFSVPLHEFKAYDEFVSNFYISLKPIGAVNNFYQTAFIVEETA